MLLPPSVAEAIRGELWDLLRSTPLGEGFQSPVVDHLSGPDRVLPEGKPNLCTALTFLSCASAGRGESMSAVPAAAAMELLAVAGDLVDDIQDGDLDLGGDRRTVGEAVGSVSLLIVLAHAALGRLADLGIPHDKVVRAFRTVDSLLVDSLAGQTLDLEMESHVEVSVEDAIGASCAKSASLVRCAAELGASLATDALDDIELYGRFGWHFGLMLQLMNDIAGVWPMGSTSSDLRLRKKTLPIVFASRARASRARRSEDPHARILREYTEPGLDAQIDEDSVRWALWRSGAIHFAWMVAAREKAQAARIAGTLEERGHHGHVLERLLA